MNSIIRKATIEDLNSINQIFINSYKKQKKPEYFKENISVFLTKPKFEELIIKDSFIILIAEKESRILGFILGEILKYEETEENELRNFAILRQINVIEEEQRQGIGTLLFSEFKEICNNRNIFDFELLSWEYLNVKEFYSKLGFKTERYIMRLK